MRQALEVRVTDLAGAVVEEEHGAAAAGEVLLEREDLPAVAKRALREEADLRQRVEHHARRLHALDLGEQGVHRLAQLHLGGMEERVLVRGLRVLRELHLEDRDPVERPAMRIGDGAKLLFALGERDVEASLLGARGLAEKRDSERGLTDARIALEEIEAARRQPSAEDVVEPFDPGLRARRLA